MQLFIGYTQCAKFNFTRIKKTPILSSIRSGDKMFNFPHNHQMVPRVYSTVSETIFSKIVDWLVNNI